MVKFLEVKLKKVWGPSHPWLCPLEFVALRLLHTELPATYQVVYIFLPQHRFLWRFLVMGFCSNKLSFSVFTYLSKFGGRSLPCDLTSLMDLKKIIVDFQFVHHFTYCQNGVGTSKILYMLGPCSSFFFFLTTSNSDFLDVIENQNMTVYKNNFMALRYNKHKL